MIVILVLVLALGWSSTLLAQTPFYQGKTIFIVVGTEGAFLAEAEKLRLEIDPTQWDEMDSLAKDVIATPADVVARMRKLLGDG
jgi:hypothetical protein